jgi:ribulose-phosphate 3-epimerase
MAAIVPAILESSFDALCDKLAVLRTVSPRVQIDICDGNFVPAVTWPYIAKVGTLPERSYDHAFREILASEGEVGMPYAEELNIELDLMVQEPKILVPHLLALGPSKLIFHIESLTDPVADMQALRKMIPGIVSIGIAFHGATPLAQVEALLDEGLVTSVQCMGIAAIGMQGQPFDTATLEKIAYLRNKYPNLSIAVDGGVNKDTISKLRVQGADDLVVGSAIWNDNQPIRALRQLESLV